MQLASAFMMRSAFAPSPVVIGTCVVCWVLAGCLLLDKGATADGFHLRLAMLSPRRHLRLGWDINAAATTMAISRAAQNGLLQGYNVSIEWADDKCNGKKAAGLAVDFWRSGIDGFIGPPCSSGAISAGLLASYWNLPMFSPASTDPTLSNKKVYSTLVRMGPPFTKMGAAIGEIFTHFGWSRFVMISRRPLPPRFVFCDYAARSIEEHFRPTNVTLGDWVKISDGVSEVDIDRLLTSIQQRGRIVILCADEGDEHNILRRAHARGMGEGDYAYLILDHLPPSNVKTPWSVKGREVAGLKEIYKSVLLVTLASLAGEEVVEFRKKVVEEMTKPPWNYNDSLVAGKTGSEYAAFFHDVVYLYLRTVNYTLEAGGDPRNGTLMFNNARSARFQGISGQVLMDRNADRDPNYWLWHLKSDGSEFTVWAEVQKTSLPGQRLQIDSPGTWNTPYGKAPADTPSCGFFGELCLKDNNQRDIILSSSLVVVVLTALCLLAGSVYYRKKKSEAELQRMLWKIKYDELTFLNDLKGSTLFGSNFRSRSRTSISRKSLSHREGTVANTDQVKIAHFRGNVVNVRLIQAKCVNLTQEQLKEFNIMRQMQHDNITGFVGACMDPPNVCIVMSYCSRGTLQDILGNDDIKLDSLFKSSLMQDISNGLYYLHTCPLMYHGNLTSDTCTIDNRWVLKLTDFGALKVRKLHKQDDVGEYQSNKEMLWTAPELLREEADGDGALASKESDIYSFGILLQEVIYRCLPYGVENGDPQLVVNRVRAGETPPFRPSSCLTPTDEGCAKEIFTLMSSCWAEVPGARPTIAGVRKVLRDLNKGRKINIMDNMLNMMEKYANNLEEIVEHRTNELLDEKQKSDALLYSMLPKAVADRLKQGAAVDPEVFDSVTIFFSDIVGFTTICSSSSAMQVVNLLNDLYTFFDGIITSYDVYKVETIGDAYMVTSGLPTRNGDNHACEIANMALDLISGTKKFRIRHQPETPLLLRVGVHSGPCCAGVVGLKMPRYCLFGDAVNTASRMESNGEALRIHISSDTHFLLYRHGGFEMERRGEIPIKGKGQMTTYWLKHRLTSKHYDT